jgi:aconitate hydratase
MFYYPDTLVGTDSHTTMINGIGIVGWGVGGIEAEAGMLGQPVYFLTPDVVGVHLTGALREGVTATDLALTVTQLMRKAKVVGKFVEFFGPGAAALPVVDRATIANMAPEYGATMGFFPIDAECVNYLRATGRDEKHIATYEAYYKAQGLWGIPQKGAIDYSQVVDLDLATVVPSVAGPKRPQDRIELPNLKGEFRRRVQQSRSPKMAFGKKAEEFLDRLRRAPGRAGTKVGHGSVLIAAITSCTNTSNPSVMLAAGLLAKKAVEKGLKVNPIVKSSLAPGSRVVTDYLDKTGLSPYLDQLGFQRSATAARPASATPARSTRRSRRPS